MTTMTTITTMKIEQAIAHAPHPRWPRRQGGGPCECAECATARRARSDAAAEARREALARGHSESVADCAASLRLHPGTTVDAAIAAAIARARC